MPFARARTASKHFSPLAAVWQGSQGMRQVTLASGSLWRCAWTASKVGRRPPWPPRSPWNRPRCLDRPTSRTQRTAPWHGSPLIAVWHRASHGLGHLTIASGSPCTLSCASSNVEFAVRFGNHSGWVSMPLPSIQRTVLKHGSPLAAVWHESCWAGRAGSAGLAGAGHGFGHLVLDLGSWWTYAWMSSNVDVCCSVLYHVGWSLRPVACIQATVL
mmetsp:Transcript_14688/g.41998  ORF Transcript_14688/g.41998 Transcript_14688/m.41998 type:complete len:215 (-) Transcript_14688:75-719(-)